VICQNRRYAGAEDSRNGEAMLIVVPVVVAPVVVVPACVRVSEKPSHAKMVFVLRALIPMLLIKECVIAVWRSQR
jgi:hypothetical protein